MMATRTVHSSAISGAITAPASKSYAQRALAASLLSNGTSILRNPSRSDDSLAAMDVIQALGASLEDFGDRLIIHGGLSQVRSTLDFGEAGLGIRLFSSIAALQPYPVYLTGTGSLARRPMHIIEEALIPLGVSCETDNGLLPIRIQGPLQGGTITIDGSLSSQVLTGLLLALPRAPEDSVIRVKQLKSKPYIDMTLEIMKVFGVKVDNDNYIEFRIAGNQNYRPVEYQVEGDWSGAAFMLVSGAIGGRVSVGGLNTSSLQADRKIMEALESAGANINIKDNYIDIERNKLKGFDFDATHCPDLFPPLLSLAAHCSGKSIIKGADRLLHKESNRAAALESEMSKLGVDVSFRRDRMVVKGPATIKGNMVDSHNDHRIAMAAATIVLPARDQEVIIKGSECVAKSYPSFFEDLKHIGGIVNE